MAEFLRCTISNLAGFVVRRNSLARVFKCGTIVRSSVRTYTFCHTGQVQKTGTREAIQNRVRWLNPFCSQLPLLHGFSTEDRVGSSKDDEYPPLPEYEFSMTSKIEESEVFLVRARGVPFTCTVEDVLHFFSECQIRNGPDGIHFTFNKDGRRSGEVLIEMESEDDVQKALAMHQKYMGHRYVEVYELQNHEAENLLRYTLQISDVTVHLRGLPYSVYEEDINHFFADLDIVPGGIKFLTNERGKKTGDAFVTFASPDHVKKALLKHKKTIGSRYIEVFPCRRNENSKFPETEKTEPFRTMCNIFHSEEKIDNENATAAPYTRSSGKNLATEHEPTQSSSLPTMSNLSAVNCIHMRGLPFQATGKDIADFFAPLRPVKIVIEYGPDGRATGEADVLFTTKEDSVAAMVKDKCYMRHRYIELFLNNATTSGS